MPPAFSGNHTGIQIYELRCGGSHFPPRICGFRLVSTNNEDISGESFRLFKLLLGFHNSMERGPENENFMQQKLLSSSTILPPPGEDQQSSNDELLQFVAFKILLPIVMILIAICFVLGVVLIVKSYMMAPLKQNLATAIRRRRRVGQAPENNYIPQAEIRASQRMSMSSSSDRKSLPPPEVLMAARERASQLMSA